MKLLIHDLTASEWEKTADDYRNCKVISDTGTIRPCIGCFHCWTGGKGEDIYADPSAFPRWLYILIANTNRQRLKRADRPGRRQRCGDEK